MSSLLQMHTHGSPASTQHDGMMVVIMSTGGDVENFVGT